MTTDFTQLTGDYAAAWLPWLMIPLVFYILPFPIFAIVFLWIERETGREVAIEGPTEAAIAGTDVSVLNREAPSPSTRPFDPEMNREGDRSPDN